MLHVSGGLGNSTHNLWLTTMFEQNQITVSLLLCCTRAFFLKTNGQLRSVAWWRCKSAQVWNNKWKVSTGCVGTGEKGQHAGAWKMATCSSMNTSLLKSFTSKFINIILPLRNSLRIIYFTLRKLQVRFRCSRWSRPVLALGPYFVHVCHMCSWIMCPHKPHVLFRDAWGIWQAQDFQTTQYQIQLNIYEAWDNTSCTPTQKDQKDPLSMTQCQVPQDTLGVLQSVTGMLQGFCDIPMEY